MESSGSGASVRLGSALVSAVLAVLLFAGDAAAATPQGARATSPPPQLAPSAAIQMQALKAIKAASTPLERKIDSRLYLGVLHGRRDIRLTSLTDFRFVKPESDGLVAVDILLDGIAGLKETMSTLESLGGVVLGKSSRYMTLRARVHLEDLESLAGLIHVRRIRQAIPFLTNVVNVSEGDLTHGAAEARGFFGTTGAGVKVGVLSDGVASLADLQTSGDLPAVQVLPGQTGSGNEGSAMLEIVHDLAPEATLAFATAGPSEAQFAQNILDLAAAGCNVIVDDVIYLDESPFQDGPVAQAVNTVTANGVLYFSSAGNEGNKDDGTTGTWEGDFHGSPAPDPGPLAGANLHNFGDGANSIIVEVGAGPNTPVILIWAENYNLNTGNASTDFDIYDMNGTLTTIFDSSTDTQNGSGGDDFPVEIIGGGTFTGERLLIDKFAAGSTSSVPMLNLIVFRGELDNTLATSGATRGHSASASAFSVAATPAAQSADGVSPDGPYPGLFNALNASESFTSDGPRRILLNANGTEITPGNRTSTGGVVRQKPDITAADGVSCAAPGFATFYGTSAAAPHAAALAALLKSAVPALTPAQVRTALVGSAIDIETAGVDRNTGAGIVMAHAALAAAGAEEAAFLAAGVQTRTEISGDGDAFVEPNEIWELKVPMTNTGGLAATAIGAFLTTATPGITIVSGASLYPDLAVGASASNSTAFRFAVAPGFGCSEPIEFALHVAYTGGLPQSFPLSIPTGSGGGVVTFTYAGAAVPIPDGLDGTGNNPGALASANLTVNTGGANIYKVALRIDGSACNATAGSPTVGIDHSWVNDLRVTLRSPSGTTVQVIRHTDGSGNNFCQTILDDSGATSIQSVVTANAPFTGTFTPLSPLSAFAGEPADGVWKLQAQDFFNLDTGNIRAFSLLITPAVCNAATLAPEPMAVDAHATAGDSSNHNGVFEPGETVQVAPAWLNTSGATPLTPTGTASLFAGGGVATYTLTDPTAAYGTIAPGSTVDCSAGDCYLFTATGTRPTQHWDATFKESLSSGVAKTWTLHLGLSFGDVPPSNQFYKFIETVFHNSITGGCGGTSYCPGNPALRKQMAIFLLRSKEGPGYLPPPAVGIFADVPPADPFARWIEELYNRGVIKGCSVSPLNYCPNNTVLRQQMGVFLLRTLEGGAYNPPACTVATFTDVPCSNPFSPWIYELVSRGITSGCGVGIFCPTNPNTRGQMAVFLVKTFGLPLYGP